MKTHCKRRHALTPENVRIRVQHGKYKQRNCRMCEVILSRKRYGEDRTEAYVPIDEILASPSTRILRLLRRCDWFDFLDICDALEVSDRSDKTRLQNILHFLVAQGQIDSCSFGHRKSYRINKVGVAKLESTLKRYDALLDAVSLTDDELTEERVAA